VIVVRLMKSTRISSANNFRKNAMYCNCVLIYICEKHTYQIERTEVCSSGFGKIPERRMRISKDHHSKL